MKTTTIRASVFMFIPELLNSLWVELEATPAPQASGRAYDIISITDKHGKSYNVGKFTRWHLPHEIDQAINDANYKEYSEKHQGAGKQKPAAKKTAKDHDIAGPPPWRPDKKQQPELPL